MADTGEGIPPADIPRLTERFYRVDRARSRELGGTGLGLAIVKHILQLHQGSLKIESRLREGTTVTVWLPAAAGREAGVARDTQPARIDDACALSCGAAFDVRNFSVPARP